MVAEEIVQCSLKLSWFWRTERTPWVYFCEQTPVWEMETGPRVHDRANFPGNADPGNQVGTDAKSVGKVLYK